MPKTTGARHFAEAMRGYGVTHLFFVPAIVLKAAARTHSRAWSVRSSPRRGGNRP
jgi:hypothetical protein